MKNRKSRSILIIKNKLKFINNQNEKIDVKFGLYGLISQSFVCFNDSNKILIYSLISYQ